MQQYWFLENFIGKYILEKYTLVLKMNILQNHLEKRTALEYREYWQIQD